MQTPQRKKVFSNVSSTNHRTPSAKDEVTLNLKEKVIELMEEITNMEVEQVHNKKLIQELSSAKEQLELNIKNFLMKANANTLQDVLLIVKQKEIQTMKLFNKITMDKLTEQDSHFQMYKTILSKQLQSKQSLKGLHQTLSIKYGKIQNKYKELQERDKLLANQNIQLEQQLQKINGKYEKETQYSKYLREELDEIKKQYQKKIKQLEVMDQIVTQKLDKYTSDVEMREEQFKRQIKYLKQRLDQKQYESLDSPTFGIKNSIQYPSEQILPKDEKEIKTNRQQNMNYQCLKVSIEGLLQENQQLKKCLFELYSHFKNQSKLDQSIQKEIKLIVSIVQIGQND